MAIGEDRPKTMLAIFAALALAFFGFGFYSYRWRPFSPPDTSFSVSMPGVPHELVQTIDAPDGAKLENHSAIVEHPWFGLSKNEYGVFWLDFTAEECGAETFDRDNGALRLLSAVRTTAHAEIVLPKEITFQGRPGWEVRASVVGMIAREVIAKVFWIDCRIYGLMMVHGGASGVDADETRFFESFVARAPIATP